MSASNTRTINTITTAVGVYVTSYKAGMKAVDTIVAAIKDSVLPFDRKELAQPLMVAIAKAYGVELIAKERGEGFTWDLDNSNAKVAREHNAAKQCHKELLGKLFADTKEQTGVKEEIKITRAQLALIRACHEAGVTMKMFGQGVAKIKA